MSITIPNPSDILSEKAADAMSGFRIPSWALHSESWFPMEADREHWLQLRRNFEYFEVSQLVYCNNQTGRITWGKPVIQFNRPERELTTRDMGKIRLETTAVNNTVLRARQVTDPTLKVRKPFGKGGGRK